MRELEIRDRLHENPNAMEEGLSPIGKEVVTGAGGMDLVEEYTVG